MPEKILTSWNVNSLKVRQPQLLAYLEQYPCDLIGLQELKQKTAPLTPNPFAIASCTLPATARKPTTASPCSPVIP